MYVHVGVDTLVRQYVYYECELLLFINERPRDAAKRKQFIPEANDTHIHMYAHVQLCNTQLQVSLYS